MAALYAHADDSDRPRDPTIEDALASLKQALKILDDKSAPPHIRARLEEVIDSLNEEIRSRPS
jgi:hypothetical protein